jgi:hypothetical protein
MLVPQHVRLDGPLRRVEHRFGLVGRPVRVELWRFLGHDDRRLHIQRHLDIQPGNDLAFDVCVHIRDNVRLDVRDRNNVDPGLNLRIDDGDRVELGVDFDHQLEFDAKHLLVQQ